MPFNALHDNWQYQLSDDFARAFQGRIFAGEINVKLLNMTEKRKYLCIDRSCDVLLLCTSTQYFFLTNFAFLFSFPECGWPTLNWTINSAKEANNSGERGKSRNSTTQVGSTAINSTNKYRIISKHTIISLYFHFRLCTVEKVIQMGNRSYGQRRRQDRTYWIFKKLSQIQSSNTVLY